MGNNSLNILRIRPTKAQAMHVSYDIKDIEIMNIINKAMLHFRSEVSIQKTRQNIVINPRRTKEIQIIQK